MKKPLMVKTHLDAEIDAAVRQLDHKAAAIWACDCAERVLPLFERKSPQDGQPRAAITAARKWINDGVFHMADVRKASLNAHAAARDVMDDHAARSAARAAGHAIATAHVKTHAIAAAIYAATAVGDEAESEREWQLQHLQELAGHHLSG